ncbi:MAG: hypothetical protein ACRC4L_04010 [Mycoplasma sp.]
MANKNLKFGIEETHAEYEKTTILPTEKLDLDKMENNDFELLLTKDLEYKLNNEILSEEDILIIKNILKNRK